MEVRRLFKRVIGIVEVWTFVLEVREEFWDHFY